MISEIISTATLLVLLIFIALKFFVDQKSKKAVRLCVTLRQSEGEFIGLLVEKHWKRWTFEHCQLMPSSRSEAPVPVDGRLHVSPSNVLYYQQLPAKAVDDADK